MTHGAVPRVPGSAGVSGVRAQLAGLQRPVQLHPQDPGDRREHGPLQDPTSAGNVTVPAIYQSKHHSKTQYSRRSDLRRYYNSDLPE